MLDINDAYFGLRETYRNDLGAFFFKKKRKTNFEDVQNNFLRGKKKFSFFAQIFKLNNQISL